MGVPLSYSRVVSHLTHFSGRLPDRYHWAVHGGDCRGLRRVWHLRQNKKSAEATTEMTNVATAMPVAQA